MIMSFRPKMGAIMAAAPKKPDFVQPLGEAKPPEFDMAEYASQGVEMAAQRLIEGVRSGEPKAVVSALKNLLALMECVDDMESGDD